MLDYATLRIIWWLLMGVLLAAFAIFDGFDLGAAAMLPFVAKNDTERRIIINTVGPVWEGNQVWFILAGGVFFAAWPYLYAVSFSGFYLAMFLLLVTFIMRPVGFKYRSKLSNPLWRNTWDWILSVSGIIASVIFGVALGNVMQGVPFYFDNSLRMFYTGSLFALFNPFALLCGISSLMMIAMQGGVYLATKTDAVLQNRVISVTRTAATLLILLYAIGSAWVAFGISGYVFTDLVNPAGPSNPLHKVVVLQRGAWIVNYLNHPILLVAPLSGLFGALGAILWVGQGRGRIGFFSSSLSVLGIIGSIGFSMFPFILPSISVPDASLTVWDSSASQLSLTIMLGAAVVFLPIILLYTAWVYRVMRGKVTAADLQKNDQAY